ncbi:uncharacterized protein LOC116267700 [Nymphaea colorata]|nr:uncharacterized protein LOC116267700 [Nymphaea colorata]
MASSFPDPFVFGILPGMSHDASPAFSIAESESDFPAEFPLIPSLLDFLPAFDSFHATRPSFSGHINVPAYPNPGWLPDPGSVSSRPARHFSPEDFGSHCLRRPASEFEVGVDALLPDLRRVLSAGDIQENRSRNIIDGVEEMGLRVCRYSPEEKKERIERYLKKKNLRNFNKTIKYACRKTLADSRQRIRGRFARNDELQDSISRTAIGEIPHGDEVQDSELLSYY